MSVSYFAEYSDGSRYQVVYDPTERKTHLRTTSGGKMDVPFLVNGASFVRYDFDYTPPKGLRACDWGTNVARLHAQLQLLTPPTKPADLTIPQTQPEDFRLHVDQGGNSFRVLQEAGARGEMEYLGDRQRARQQALQTLNEGDARKIQEARQIRNEIARKMRPRGGGQFIVKTGE